VTDAPDLDQLLDLASRALGGSVVAANDDSFAEKENLIKPQAPTHDPLAYDHRGKVYDGWETRRRRSPGHDWAIVRLGAPGVIRQVVVDTAFFAGNYPPTVEIHGLAAAGSLVADELAASPDWVPLVPRSPVAGDSTTGFEVEDPRRYTHVRLRIFPDGGVARLRVRGEVVPDPAWLAAAPLDLLAQENGGLALAASDAFYSSPHALNAPGQARHTGEGWENRRRRDDGNDWVRFRLAASGLPRALVLDTTHFVHNAPGWAAVWGCDEATADPEDPAAWFPLLPRTRLLPDAAQRFLLPGAGPTGDRTATHVRLDVFPDGGLTRLRLYGTLSEAGRADVQRRWDAAQPD
jgi:allantoicase